MVKNVKLMVMYVYYEKDGDKVPTGEIWTSFSCSFFPSGKKEAVNRMNVQRMIFYYSALS